jgi:hypothetical protein
MVRWLIVIGALAALPASGYAQEAVLTGTVTDSTGGVLPGVVITAVHVASGNSFDAVTEGSGSFRLSVRVGIYRISGELQGFAQVTRAGLELLVGQQVVVNLQMVPSSLQESITVSGESPLVDVTSSTVGSNVDRRQMEELPLNGRNFVDLTMLAPGSRQNASADELGALGTFQLNLDGQRVTQNQTANFGQPKYSRDAIAEFEFIANRFDATMGGSSGTMVNAITKSGTNAFDGTFSSYFRNDTFIAKDFVQKRVLPYSDTQMSWTFGGPLRKDRAHFFGNYEYEREPQTFSHSSPYPGFNFDHSGTRTEQKGGGRLDFQFTPQVRLTARGNKSLVNMPFDQRYTGGATRHPSSAITTERHSTDLGGTLTQVLGTRALNEVRVGYQGYYWIQQSIVRWPDHPYPGLDYGTPIINLRSYTIGQAHTNSHEDERQDTYSFRDNFTFTFSKGGRHDVKAGGEYIYQQNPVFLCNRCMGIYDAMGGAIPADIESLFPVWNDVSSWNLAALSPIVRSYTLGVGQMKQYAPLKGFGTWVQDDWQISQRLTLNLGLRYDLQDGVYSEDVELEPFLKAGRKNDINNWAPRLGFAYSLTEKTVVRGGAGRYFADPGSHTAYWTRLSAYALHPQVFNDGRADFAANPFNGPTPTFDQVAQTLCTVERTATCLRRSIGTLAAPYNVIPYSNQVSVGMQRQFGSTMSLEADYVYTGNREQHFNMNINLAYDPATGINLPFNNLSLRPYPDWADVSNRLSTGKSSYHGLQMAFTKRFSDRWQASATYLLAGQWNLQNAPIPYGCEYPTTLMAPGQPVCDVPFELHPSLIEEWYLTGDQRHRATFNGIWSVGRGLQLSGLYFYGDNGWATPSSGVDVLQSGSSGGRVRADGTLIPRNSFDLPSLHRVDMRLQQRLPLGSKASIDGIVEVFNVFNHANYASFVTNESSSRYGQPNESLNVSYQPRLLQFGFRASF